MRAPARSAGRVWRTRGRPGRVDWRAVRRRSTSFDLRMVYVPDERVDLQDPGLNSLSIEQAEQALSQRAGRKAGDRSNA